MLEGFKKVGKSSRNGGAEYSVTIGSLGTFIFGKSVVSCMQAKYVLMLFNEDTRQIAIQKCDKSTEDRVKFFYDENKERDARITRRGLQQTLARLMNWDLDKYNYHVSGFYLAKDNAMVFDLMGATRTPRSHKRRGGKHDEK